MEIKGIRLNTIELAIPSFLGLSLIKVGLCSSFTVKLLNFIGVDIEKIAVVCFLIRSCKTTKYNHVII